VSWVEVLQWLVLMTWGTVCLMAIVGKLRGSPPGPPRRDLPNSHVWPHND
jgi:hypothetical protein